MFPTKMSNVTNYIRESPTTIYEHVNFESTKNMNYELPYEIMWFERGLTPYGVKITMKLTGNGENFKVSLPERYEEKLDNHFIYRMNNEKKT